jgi:Asp-tRNA(Asn)/Glu-tRNA(Gln) amidotransferase A subunit family amidase
MPPPARSGLGMARPVALAQFAGVLRSGQLSAVEAARESIAAIEASQPEINAFIRVTAGLAMAQARHADELRAAGTDLGSLMGAPVAVKDLFDVAGVPTTAGSRLFADRVATGDAAAVGRLVAAGAVIVGKANMDQFAMGPHQDDYGRTNCPADPARYAGGSSGGSAAAVAAGLAVAALGSDAGGSTRHPAACCGVAGFKPTFGAVPTAGAFPTFPSVDHVGVIARDIAGIRAVFAAISGASGTPAQDARPPRIAVLHGWQEGCDDHVTDKTGSALAAAAAAGATLTTGTQVTGFADSTATLVDIVRPEAFAALAPHLPEDGEGVPPAFRTMLASARKISAVSYLRAQAARDRMRAAVDAVLADHDVLAMPTSAVVAWRWADIDKESMGVDNPSTRFLPFANLTGNPAISVPVPCPGSLPVGLQLIGRRGADFHLLDVASWVERALARSPGV